MLIRENSWHFQLYQWFFDTTYSDFVFMQQHGYKTNLTFCKYARKIFLGLLISAIIGTAALMVAFSTIEFWIYLAIHGTGWISHKSLGGFFESCANFGLVANCVFGICFAIVGTKKLVEMLYNRVQEAVYARSAANEQKEPGFFSSWYHSVKDKFCPTLEFKDASVS
jgi:hypothetical protein